MRFLMTDPRHFNVSYQINPWMEPAAWTAEAAEAASQGSRALRDAIAATGAVVETVPAVEGLPDLVFPANAAIVLDGKVLVARFLCAERQGEEAVFRAAFEGLRARGIVKEVVELPQGVLQEGAGDAIWDIDRGFFWVGYGQRSTQSSIAVIESTFGQATVALELASPRFYHLDTCFCPLSGGKVLYYPPAFTPEALAAIRARVMPQDRIEATDEEAGAFCVNAVNIGRTIIMAKAPESLRLKLADHGYTLREVDLAPFILSGGGAYCMTLRLDRTAQAQAGLRAAE
ncbi:MAG: amidinotransferase [Alphaproteobacteria bacterium]|nr:amidinotransferase [Alphaproteobacteria bacterium]MDB5739549.1 amidinotransferase [Alphaproteobacteria bacterium]